MFILAQYKQEEDPWLSKHGWKWLTSFGICYKTEDLKVLRYCCLTILPRFRIFFNEGFCFVFKKAVLFLSGCRARLQSSLSRGRIVVPELCLICTSHNQPRVVSVIPLVLCLVIPIHGAFHCFDPISHILFIFLPFLLWLENYFTLPQFL